MGLLECCRDRNARVREEEDAATELEQLMWQQPQPLDRVKEIVEQFPRAVRGKDPSSNNFPIHTACSNRASLEIIETLVEAWPKSLEMLAADLETPLHLACLVNSPVQIIAYLADTCPKSLMAPNKKNERPIHLACRSNPLLDVVEYLVAKSPKSLHARDNKFNLPLHVACAQRASQDVIAVLIAANPEALLLQNRSGDTPLHVCVEKRGSPNLIKLLIDNEPKALLVANKEGDLPLHVACRREASMAVVQVLVENGRDALKSPNAGGDLPLHVACESRGMARPILQLLVEEGTDAIVTPNGDGNLPLHLACGAASPMTVAQRNNRPGPGTSAPVAVLELLLERWPDSIHTANGIGRLPLHVACGTKHPSLNVVTFLLQRGPRDVREADNDGLLPLHVACGHTQASLAVIQRLVHAWADGGPEGEGMPERQASGEDETLEQAAVVRERRDGLASPPTESQNALGGLKIATPDGNTALHLACYYKAPLDVVQFLVHRWPQSVTMENENGETAAVLVENPYRGVPSQDVLAWLSNLSVRGAEADAAQVG